MIDEVVQPDDEPTPPRSLLELSGRERDVLAALAGKDQEAGALYESALRVLGDPENPRRVRLAACGLREALDSLHEQKQGEDLGQRVKRLSVQWEVARRSLGVADGGLDSGFVQTLESFFVAYEEDYPGRRKQASETIGRLDPSGRTAPPTVHDARGRNWMDFRSYLSNVVHGKTRPTEQAFRARLEAFERFLLDWLRPRTFDDLSEIDDLIAKGPPDG